MKYILFILCITSFVGCVNYPKEYNYSPTVTYNGGGGEALPDPFGRGNHTRKTTIVQNDSAYSYPYPTITVPVDPSSPPPPNPWGY
jgi:hypothetical protein